MKNQSLQDQLLNAGLTNQTKVKQLRAEKRKQSKKQRKNNKGVVDEAKLLAGQTKARQLEKDRLLNEQRNKEAEKKQIVNQIQQLIEANKMHQGDEGIAYHFTDEKKVKTIYVDERLRNKIIAGQLAIVKYGNRYEVVPLDVAAKIKQKDQQLVVVWFSDTEIEKEGNEYQGYEIPDDLMW